ncbi:MAG: hypothetical protein HY554_06090 [Elusimicrobia bacterium]|nr:hypothetical protein [Elusimicrobiota bacterium]
MRAALALAALLAAPAAAQPETAAYEARPGILRQRGFVLFFGGQGPLSYGAPVPGRLPPDASDAGEVRGRSCQHGVSVPLGLGLRSARLSGGGGRGGFDRALADLHRRHPGLRGVYDAKIDDHVLGVLGVYQRLCTEVAARGFR